MFWKNDILTLFLYSTVSRGVRLPGVPDSQDVETKEKYFNPDSLEAWTYFSKISADFKIISSSIIKMCSQFR
jgi:hypothetical protein